MQNLLDTATGLRYPKQQVFSLQMPQAPPVLSPFSGLGAYGSQPAACRPMFDADVMGYGSGPMQLPPAPLREPNPASVTSHSPPIPPVRKS